MKCIEILLNEAATELQKCSDSPRLDAEVLLAMAIEKNRTYLRTWPEKILTQEQLQKFNDAFARRRQGIPIAYITCSREFWSREFTVNKQVLIPRPDTELIIELTLNLIPEQTPCRLIDLGTGSGVIGITLAAERPRAVVVATDISPQALALAQHNADNYQLSNISFIESNWFQNLPDSHFDLIVSNPPYIAEQDPHLSQGDVRYEPRMALISQKEGLNDITLIAESARNHLKPDGHLLIEHGYDQEQPVQEIFKQLNYQHIKTHLDLSGHPRVTYGQWRS